MPWDARVKRRIKLRDLDILMAVIRAGSMGKAAIHLGMSQPAVSKAVADLEAALGVRLLNRSRVGAEPTLYGIALTKRGTLVFNELRQGVQDIEFLSDPSAGELRIAATEAIAGAIVAPAINGLVREHPRIAFHVVTGDQAGTLYRNLSERNVELAITRLHTLPEDFSAETLFLDPMVIVAGANNPLTRRRKLTLAELMDEFWIQQPPENSFGSLVAEVFKANGLPLPRFTVSASSTALRSAMLATGGFITFVAGFTVKLPRRHPTFKVLPVALPDTRHPVVIITLRNRELSPLAQSFIERVRSVTRPLANS